MATATTTATMTSKSTKSRVTTLARAMAIAHEHWLNLVGVTLASDPLVIKAVDIDRHAYDAWRRAARASSAKRMGMGAISD